MSGQQQHSFSLRWRRRLRALSAAGALACAAPLAGASVILTFDDGDAGAAATAVTVTPTGVNGASFSVNLRLTAGSEVVTGVNYDVIARRQSNNQTVNGIFQLTARSLTGPPASAYSDTSGVMTDAEVAAAAKFLNPDTGQNLGSTTPTGTSTTSSTFQVARLTFRVPTGTAPGVYTISTESPGNDPTLGYVGPGPSFPDHPFDGQAVYTVTVAPEPGSLMLVGACAAPLALRRRRRAGRSAAGV